jgi:hypothetical protein
MAQVSSLWVGKPLTRAHKVALRSFVYYGHSIKLYVYDMDLDVPPGVVKADANEIVPKSDMFIHYGKLAPFADYFRYKMIAKTNEMWVDADTICLSEYFFEDKEYVFIEEMPGFYAQGILKMPASSDLCKFLNEKASSLMINKNEIGNSDPSTWTNEDNKNWIFLGPGLMTEAVNKFSLQHYGQAALLVNGLDLSVSREDPYDLLWNPTNLDKMAERLNSSISLTFFNSSLEWRGLSEQLNNFPEGSLIKELEDKVFKQD